VARGYLHQPALTAEKFVPHPFSQAPGARVYKTGDQVRWRDTGMLEFLGRQDNQIKLRGYRIELGEIEAALSQHPHVQETVVMCREDNPTDKHLVAYVTKAQDSLEVSEVRAALQAQLPGYMVPSAFIVLEQLPLTPNGKINRRALPAPAGADRTQGMSYVAPRTPFEHTLVNIWQDVLGLDQVGVHDNFFDLGGHSLMATQVVSRVRQEFYVDLKLMDFFKMPTIAELSKGLEGLLWVNAGKPSEDEAELQTREEGVV
jgi:acyl carrier protein